MSIAPAHEPPIEISVVVPCFNEAEVIETTIARLQRVANSVSAAHELLFVDDGSSDATWSLIMRARQNEPRVRGIRLSRNFGQQAALSAGLAHARGGRVLVIDADLQDPPELLPEMYAKMGDGFDVVYGQRRTRKGETWFKLATARVFYRLIGALSEVSIPLDTGDFRLMSRRAVDALLQLPERVRYLRGMIAWIGFPQAAIPYDRDARTAGETKWTTARMIRFSMDAITAFSVRPLRVAVIAAGFQFAAAALISAWALIRWLDDGTVRGWTSLIIAILVVGSIQAFVLGVLGEYVGRLFVEAKSRPVFIVQDDTAALPPSELRSS